MKDYSRTIFLIDRQSIQVDEFFENQIPGCTVDDHMVQIGNDEFEIFSQEIVGVDAGDIYAYRLVKYIKEKE